MLDLMANVSEIVFETSSYETDPYFLTVLICSPITIAHLGYLIAPAIIQFADVVNNLREMNHQLAPGSDEGHENNETPPKLHTIKSILAKVFCWPTKLGYGDSDDNSRVRRDSSQICNPSCSSNGLPSLSSNDHSLHKDKIEDNNSETSTQESFEHLENDSENEEEQETVGPGRASDDFEQDDLKEKYEELEKRAQEQKQWLEEREEQIMKEKILQENEIRKKFEKIVNLSPRRRDNEFRKWCEEVD